MTARKTTPHSHKHFYQNTDEIQINSVLSLRPLIAYIQKSIREKCPQSDYAKNLIKNIKKTPKLLEPIQDLSLLEDYHEVMDELMSFVFPPIFWKRDYLAAILPFETRAFYSTPKFRELFLDENEFVTTFSPLSLEKRNLIKKLHAFLIIGKKFYGIDFDMGFSKIVPFTNPKTGFLSYFDIKTDIRFISVIPRKKVSPLSEKTKIHLRQNADNLKIWQEIIPLENFEFQGFNLLSVVDITDEQLISSMRQTLIEADSITTYHGFLDLQEKLRAYLRLKDVVLGIAAIDNGRVILLNHGDNPQERNLFAECSHLPVDTYLGTVYYKAVKEKREIIIEDLREYQEPTDFENRLLEKGVRNMYVTPLIYKKEIIGTMQIASPNPGDIYPLNAFKLRHIIPLFGIAAKKSLDDINRRIQNIIQEKYTAIHPAVAWKFKEAAISYMNQSSEDATELKPIVFSEVYPLYAMSDIRGSSERRNRAIQQDLTTQLNMAKKILEESYKIHSLPHTDHLLYKLEKTLSNLQSEIHTGDEATTLDLLKFEIDPTLQKLQSFCSEIEPLVKSYQEALDPEHGVIYQKRKEYDQDITKINKTLSDFIEEEEEKAQSICPHYFERNATDGVDFNIYIGASLVEGGRYDSMFLKNMRLWQLKTLCGLARISEDLKSRLSEPLELTHLTLVQNIPLTIQYRLEDKQFVVNGSYNIRYEILKKRIDKAKIKGKDERVTQPGKIAIVYSQPKEAVEYREYIEYLIARKFLQKDIEELELEDLQGVKGLCAIRVIPVL
ncbi:MAG: GAF domain-containing protein [Leptospiraceae bacterium]|nr:GAF domain-containing protein [Leptospiraceae bacterium]